MIRAWKQKLPIKSRDIRFSQTDRKLSRGVRNKGMNPYVQIIGR